MKKNIFKFVLFILLISPNLFAQEIRRGYDCSPPEIAPTGRKDFRLASVNYYLHNNSTQTRTNHKSIFGNESVVIGISIGFRNKGKQVVKPNSIDFKFSLRARDESFFKNTNLKIFLDDKLAYSSTAKIVYAEDCEGVANFEGKSVPYKFQIEFSHSLDIQSLSAIINAQKVSFELGQSKIPIVSEFPNDGLIDHLKVLKQIIENEDISATVTPFSNIDDFLVQNGGDFNNRKEIHELFNEERIRLGESFETELWKYLGDDVQKHYWISSFLIWEGYLHGNKPLPELVYKIIEKGIDLLANKEDYESLGMRVTFLRNLAISSYLFGKKDLAIEYKKQAMAILKKDAEIGAYVGAMTEFDYCIYDNLEKDPTGCKK